MWIVDVIKKAGKTRFIQNILSRKFQALLIAVGLFLYDPIHFQGYYITIILLVYMGTNVATHIVENFSNRIDKRLDPPEEPKGIGFSK